MKTQVKALVVGGGAVGTSIAYHLAKAGWDDDVAGARRADVGLYMACAGLLPYFNMSLPRRISMTIPSNSIKP